MRAGPSRRPESALEYTGAGLSALAIVFGVGLGALMLLRDAGVNVTGEERVLGQAAPSLRFRMVDTDEEADLRSYAGKVVLLNLWATWCPPCLTEMPELDRLQEAYRLEGLVVLTISDEPRETLLDFERGSPLQTVSGYLPDAYDWPPPYDRVRTARPTTFVIDRQGIIRSTWPGARDFDTSSRP